MIDVVKYMSKNSHFLRVYLLFVASIDSIEITTIIRNGRVVTNFSFEFDVVLCYIKCWINKVGIWN